MAGDEPLGRLPARAPESPGAVGAADPIEAPRPGWRARLTSGAQRREDETVAALRDVTVSRPNVIAVLSPKGGVGKTTTAFLLGNVLASHARLRVIAIDANPDFGTLAALAPDDARSPRSMTDLLAELKDVEDAEDLLPFVSRLPSGLHLLAAPARVEVMAQMTPNLYGRLLGGLRRFYDVVVLDLGTGITDPIARFAVVQADRTVVVTNAEWVTAATVLGALRYLHLDRTTLLLNQAASGRASASQERIEANLRRHAVATRATLPADERLRAMLDSGRFALEDLRRPTRTAILALALTVGRDLA